MSKPAASQNTLDFDYFEKILAFNCLFPPHAAEFSGAVIDHLDGELFNNDSVRTIIEIIRSYYGEHHRLISIPELKVKLTTPEQREKVKTLFTEFTSLNAAYHVPELLANTETFIKNRMLRNVIEAAILQHETTKQYDIGAVVDRIDAAAGVTLTDDLGLNYFKDFDTYCEDLQVVNTYIPTGWAWLDEKIGGGFQENGKALYVFCGTTNVGKSIFLSNVAANAMLGRRNVLVITLEMSQQVYASRITSQLSNVGIGILPANIAKIKDMALQMKQQGTGDLIIKEYPPATINCRQIAAYIKKLGRQGFEPDIIVIDYLTLLCPNGKSGGSTYVDVKRVAEELRALSYVFECPIVTASQLNRQAYGKENPGLDTISESMGLAHTADCQINIWCSEEEKKAGVINMGMMKNRWGPNFGQVTLGIDWATLKLTEITPIDFSRKGNAQQQAPEVAGTDDVTQLLLDAAFQTT